MSGVWARMCFSLDHSLYFQAWKMIWTLLYRDEAVKSVIRRELKMEVLSCFAVWRVRLVLRLVVENRLFRLTLDPSLKSTGICLSAQALQVV